MVPGHEIVGRVRRVGASVRRFAAGDRVGVGCMVDSCRTCEPCRHDTEQFCQAGVAWTYNGTEMDRVTPTFGGYSKRVVVAERFVLRIPPGLDPAATARSCAPGSRRTRRCDSGAASGATGSASSVSAASATLAVKLAAAMGAEVTVLSTSRAKEADAHRLGAQAFVETRDPAVTAGAIF